MLISLDLKSEIPIYQQTCNQIIDGIATGRLKEGQSLPPVRQLAEDLGINLHTVNKAYNVLKHEGFLLVHRKKGVVVNPPEVYRANEEYNKQLVDTLRPVIAKSFSKGIGKQDFILLCSEIFDSLENEKKGDQT